MTSGWRTILVALSSFLALAVPLTTRGDIVVTGSFGPNGDVGFPNSPSNLSISFGAQGNGSIYQMDGFVNVPGVDLGAGVGTSADLTNGAPTGVGYTFNSSQPTASQLLLTYNFTNSSGSALPGFQFLYFVDPDIGANFADESATVNGTLALPHATSFQVGDPGLSTIFTNLANGTLSNINELPSGSPGDVSSALGFTIGSLANGQSIGFQVLLSDNGSTLGGFSITQNDPVFPSDTLTISGAVVPEPSSWLLMSFGSGAALLAATYRRVRRQA